MQEKSLKRQRKLERDFKIFDGMPYKFKDKFCSLSEKHPMTKERFEAAVKRIIAQSAGGSEQFGVEASELLSKRLAGFNFDY